MNLVLAERSSDIVLGEVEREVADERGEGGLGGEGDFLAGERGPVAYGRVSMWVSRGRV